MPRIAIVTDSTACLPADTAARLGIGVVPLQVVIKGESYSEADPATAKLLVETLRGHGTATTSRPSPEEFTAAHRAAFEAGYDGVVSLHISGELSATVEAAELAAKDAPLPVRVIDSRTAAMALGFAALAASSAGSVESAEMSAVAELAEARAAGSSAFFYVDTLEFLRRGGRIGSARALLGSALAMKPLLHVVDGRVEPLEKVRTATKAIARLEEIAVECATADGGDGGGVDIAVQHLDAGVRAEALADRLRERLPGLRDVTVCGVGAVIGAHVGPGVLGVIVSSR
jgi:DegV family protein with EDD domain